LPTWELGEKQALSAIYIWSENSSAKSEASFVLTAQTKTIERAGTDVDPLAFSISAILARSVPKIWYFLETNSRPSN
jgi:hypothetical protein